MTTARHHQLLYLIAWTNLVSTSIGCLDTNHEPLRAHDIVVAAASSLSDVLTDLKRGFEAKHPGPRIVLNFAGSQVLRFQIEQGATFDVYASANAMHMNALIHEKHVQEAQVFAYNTLIVLVPQTNPAQIHHFYELNQAKRIIIGNENVPIGIYTRQVLNRSSVKLGHRFVDTIREHVVSQESNTRLVRAKVELAEADAAIVYQTDLGGSYKTQSIPIPQEFNSNVRYFIAPLRRAYKLKGVRQFINYVLSQEGQHIIRQNGFLLKPLKATDED